MKLSAGFTLKDAIADTRPITGIKREDVEYINSVKEFYPYVIDFNQVKKGRYRWVSNGVLDVGVFDKKRGRMVTDSTGKIKVFRGVHKAKVWMYNHDRKFYESLDNLSTRKVDNLKYYTFKHKFKIVPEGTRSRKWRISGYSIKELLAAGSITKEYKLMNFVRCYSKASGYKEREVK